MYLEDQRPIGEYRIHVLPLADSQRSCFITMYFIRVDGILRNAEMFNGTETI